MRETERKEDTTCKISSITSSVLTYKLGDRARLGTPREDGAPPGIDLNTVQCYTDRVHVHGEKRERRWRRSLGKSQHNKVNQKFWKLTSLGERSVIIDRKGEKKTKVF